MYAEIENDKKTEIKDPFSPTQSEHASNLEHSFNPWMRHCRNMDWKVYSNGSTSVQDKLISPRNDCMPDVNAQETSLVTNPNEGVGSKLLQFFTYWKYF